MGSSFSQPPPLQSAQMPNQENIVPNSTTTSAAPQQTTSNNSSKLIVKLSDTKTIALCHPNIATDTIKKYSFPGFPLRFEKTADVHSSDVIKIWDNGFISPFYNNKSGPDYPNYIGSMYDKYFEKSPSGWIVHSNFSDTNKKTVLFNSIATLLNGPSVYPHFYYMFQEYMNNAEVKRNDFSNLNFKSAFLHAHDIWKTLVDILKVGVKYHGISLPIPTSSNSSSNKLFPNIVATIAHNVHTDVTKICVPDRLVFTFKLNTKNISKGGLAKSGHDVSTYLGFDYGKPIIGGTRKKHGKKHGKNHQKKHGKNHQKNHQNNHGKKKSQSRKKLCTSKYY